MMLRNVNTGTFELYDINNNMITSAAAIGQVGLEWLPRLGCLPLAFDCLSRFVAARRDFRFRDSEEQIGLNVAFSYRDKR
jgi:hypothetical protein